MLLMQWCQYLPFCNSLLAFRIQFLDGNSQLLTSCRCSCVINQTLEYCTKPSLSQHTVSSEIFSGCSQFCKSKNSQVCSIQDLSIRKLFFISYSRGLAILRAPKGWTCIVPCWELITKESACSSRVAATSKRSRIAILYQFRIAETRRKLNAPWDIATGKKERLLACMKIIVQLILEPKSITMRSFYE